MCDYQGVSICVCVCVLRTGRDDARVSELVHDDGLPDGESCF